MVHERRFERAHEAMRQEGVDAWVFCGRETHILGEPAMLFLMPTQMGGKTTVIVAADGQRIVVGSIMQMEELEASGLFTKLVTYPTLADYEGLVAEALRGLGPLRRIALDFSESDPSSDGLTVTAKAMLDRCFAAAGLEAELVSSAPLMKAVRGRKSDEEVGLIARAVEAAMEVYDAARPLMRAGMSGRDVQRLFKRLIRERELGYSWYEPENPYVSVGARSSYLCKRPPADVFIEPGDLVNVDLGIQLEGFASDDQRSFYAPREGEKAPPYEVQRAFETIQEMNATVCAHMKAGVDSDELTRYGNEIMLRNGYPQGFKGGYGHEIGIYAHNGGLTAGYNPFKPELDKKLELNMTFTLEPAILTPFGRLCQEEVVVVKEEGGRFLSRPQKEVWLIGS
ncbi:MAG TPA: M24 family metallopeptidase [Spirochaetales bacterium]|nr:M24 family metallopeptidase [Spirochaetales bacterium]HRY54196.1 M24 family metallopeptidase [Spirochaetia bacterium]HRZ64830.1 M24 family metallopeptidase [Spirochaetia bacterium]